MDDGWSAALPAGVHAGKFAPEVGRGNGAKRNSEQEPSPHIHPETPAYVETGSQALLRHGPREFSQIVPGVVREADYQKWGAAWAFFPIRLVAE